MAGLFGLSIDHENYENERFKEDLFWGTFYQQHLGEDFCGVAIMDSARVFKIWSGQAGLFRPNFESKKDFWDGYYGIGCCGSASEPLFVDSKLGPFSICFSGNIVNCQELKNDLMRSGQIFGGGTGDIEIISRIIVQGENILDGIKRMSQKIKGAYSLLVLTDHGLYAARCPFGYWPLVIGEKKGAIAVSSESGGFNNFGFKLVRDLKPGEIVLLKGEKLETKEIISREKTQICSFIWVYTAFPNGIFEGVPASLVRKRLGASLARRDIESGFIPDIVAPVPYSGGSHAIGYHNEFCHQIVEGRIDRLPLYDEVLLKYPYAGRSYTPQNEKRRKTEARIKLLTSAEDYKDQILVICDDSIVRGTQTSENLVPKLESIGFKEIHFRISNPELLSHCSSGKTTKKGELFAARIPSKKERINFLNSKSERKIVKSLEYSTIEDLARAIGLPLNQLCIECASPTKE